MEWIWRRVARSEAPGQFGLERVPKPCSSQGSWLDVGLDSSVHALPASARLVAAGPGGAVHVLYATSAGLTHTTCSANCGVAASWRYQTVAGSSVAGFMDAVSAVFGPDGRLHVAYGDRSNTVTYAVCGAPCSIPGAWSVTTLPLATTDVGLTMDGGGTLYLATTSRTVRHSQNQTRNCRGGPMSRPRDGQPSRASRDCPYTK